MLKILMRLLDRANALEANIRGRRVIRAVREQTHERREDHPQNEADETADDIYPFW